MIGRKIRSFFYENGYNEDNDAKGIDLRMKELAEAKTLLEEQPRSSKQQAVDEAVSNLENAKKGLKPASAVKPPETEKDYCKQKSQCDNGQAEKGYL